jgi:hypothetical protein
MVDALRAAFHWVLGQLLKPNMMPQSFQRATANELFTPML